MLRWSLIALASLAVIAILGFAGAEPAARGGSAQSSALPTHGMYPRPRSETTTTRSPSSLAVTSVW